MQRKARIFSAPGSPQNMPDCLQRAPMTVLHPASTTPEPMKKPWRRKVPYYMRSTLLMKYPNAFSTAAAWEMPAHSWRVSASQPVRRRPGHGIGNLAQSPPGLFSLRLY